MFYRRRKDQSEVINSVVRRDPATARLSIDTENDTYKEGYARRRNNYVDQSQTGITKSFMLQKFEDGETKLNAAIAAGEATLESSIVVC